MCLVANILCDNTKELALGSPENGKKLLLEKSSKMRQMALDFQNLVPSTDQNHKTRSQGPEVYFVSATHTIPYLNY